MKVAVKISLYVLGFVLILLLFAWIFHSAIISYALKKVIWDKSSGKIELTLDAFRLNLRDASVIIDKPALVLTDVYMNENKSIQLDSIVYEKIEIDQLDLKSLIRDRNIIAKRFLIDKPVFWISEDGSGSKSSFHPDKLISTLNQNPDIFSRIVVQIDDVEIYYGSVILSEFIAPGVDPGLVDFTLSFKNFDSRSQNGDSTGRILFSDEFRFRLRNLHKDLQSGYTLDIDSAVFSSKQRDLIVGGASLQPIVMDDEQNSVGIRAGKLVLNDVGLEEIRGVEDLNLRSIVLSDGEFINYFNIKTGAGKKSERSKGLKDIIKVLYDFRLDSIGISNFYYYNVRDYTDTVIAAAEIDFLMTDIRIDSGMFDDPFRNLHYGDITLSTGALAIKKLIPNLEVSYQRLSYNNDEHNFRLADLKVISDSAAGSLEKINLYVPGLLVEGASVQDMQKRRKQYLTITLDNPEGEIELAQILQVQSSARQKTLFPGYLVLDKIILNNGNVSLNKSGSFFIRLNGLNMALDGLNLPETKHDTFAFDKLNFDFDRAETWFAQGPVSIVTGKTFYESGEFGMQNIGIRPDNLGNKFSFRIQELNLADFDLKRLIFENILQVGEAGITAPVLKDTRANREKETETKDPLDRIMIPITFDIGNSYIKNGRIETGFMVAGEHVSLKTDYTLLLGRMASRKGETLWSLVSEIQWKLELANVNALAANHQIEANKILSDAFSSQFTIENMHVSAVPDALDSNKTVVRNLTFPRLDIAGLDYDLLINHDSIALRKLLLDRTFLNIRLANKKYRVGQKADKKFEIKDYLLFSYDTIAANNLNLLIGQSGDSSYTLYKTEGFGFTHYSQPPSNGNLMDYFGVNFSEFSFQDTINNKFFRLHDGLIETDGNTLTVGKLEGGTIINDADTALAEINTGTRLSITDISLAEIMLENKLPSRLNVGTLSAGDIDLQIAQKPSASQSMSFTLSTELIEQFDHLITQFGIDTTVFSDLSINYQSLNDSALNTVDFDSISLVINKINIDTSMAGKPRPDILQDLTLDLHDRKLITNDSMYAIHTRKLHYNYPHHRITIDSFMVIPRYGIDEFFRKAVYQTDRAILFSEKVELNDINTDELFRNNHIYVGSVDAYKLTTTLYRDKRFPIAPGTFKRLPGYQLRSITQHFTIDSMHVIDGFLQYTEHSEKSDEPGTVFFDKVNVSGYNITNVLAEGERKNLKLELSGRIMGEARMDATVFFPIHEDSTAFWLAAKTETIDLTSLNSMTENTLGIGIIRGVGSVDAPFISANDSIAHGSLVFRYKKLKLAMYNRKKSKLNQGLLTPVVNFLINDLVVKSNNPKFARKPRVGQVWFERDTRKGIVNYMWKSLLSGLTSTLGFNNREQRLEIKEYKRRQ